MSFFQRRSSSRSSNNLTSNNPSASSSASASPAAVADGDSLASPAPELEVVWVDEPEQEGGERPTEDDELPDYDAAVNNSGELGTRTGTWIGIGSIPDPNTNPKAAGWKGKGKQHDIDTDVHQPRKPSTSGPTDAQARQAYLSPPLTNAPSDAFLFGLDVSRVLSLPEVDVNIDLGLGSSSSSSPGSGSSVLSVREAEKDLDLDEQERGRALVRTRDHAHGTIVVSAEAEAADDFSEASSDTASDTASLSSSESSFISSTTIDSRRESTTTRRATLGDRTLDSTALAQALNEALGSPTTTQIPLPVPPPRPRPRSWRRDRDLSPFSLELERALERERDRETRATRFTGSTVERDSAKYKLEADRAADEVRGHHRRRSSTTTITGSRHVKRLPLRRGKYQERGLCKLSFGAFYILVNRDLSLTPYIPARDFFLIIVLCLGLACAGILLLRPTAMAIFGYGTLGGRLDLI